MADLAWLALSTCPPDSLEKALSMLLRLAGLPQVAELLKVTRDEVRGWATARKVPAEHAELIGAELKRREKTEGTHLNGNWARYRASYKQGFGSQAEIAARNEVSRQAVHRAIAYGRKREDAESKPTEPPPDVPPATPGPDTPDAPEAPNPGPSVEDSPAPEAEASTSGARRRNGKRRS